MFLNTFRSIERLRNAIRDDFQLCKNDVSAAICKNRSIHNTYIRAWSHTNSLIWRQYRGAYSAPKNITENLSAKHLENTLLASDRYYIHYYLDPRLQIWLSRVFSQNPPHTTSDNIWSTDSWLLRRWVLLFFEHFASAVKERNKLEYHIIIDTTSQAKWHLL